MAPASHDRGWWGHFPFQRTIGPQTGVMAIQTKTVVWVNVKPVHVDGIGPTAEVEVYDSAKAAREHADERTATVKRTVRAR